MKKIIGVFMLSCLVTPALFAQVAVNTDGTSPDGSAMLHIKSTSKGVLVARMTSAQRGLIGSPADGLLVYDTDTQTFWYYKAGTGWTEITGSGGLSLPFTATANDAGTLFSIANDGDGTSLEGVSNSTSSSIAAMRGMVSSTSPGGFSSAVRGINNGTGGLGIGVWGSQNGSGWGVYGATPDGIGVYGNSSAAGYGVYANSNNGTGLTATSTNGTPANMTISNNANTNDVLTASTLGNGNVISVLTGGGGKGLLSSTAGGFAVHGVTSAQSSAGIVGDNNGNGEAVVGRTTSDIAGAVVGRNDGGGYGVRGFVATNTDNTAIGVFGQVGLNGSTGRGGRFENSNATNTDANTLEVETNGDGNIPDNTLGNAASFLVDNTNSVGAAVRGEVNTIFGNFGAAGIFGVSSGTGGRAGLFYASNPVGNGDALVALTDGNGNGITANAGNDGNGVESTVDGNGNAIYGWVPSFGDGRAARFANFNTANATSTVYITNDGTGNALLINHTGSSGNIATCQDNGTNVARIDKNGKGYFNGGTQAFGADLAEAFDVEGSVAEYEPGDVLVISVSSDRTIAKSTGPYSSLVAGVYATKPGVLLAEASIDADISGKVPMGVVGVIPTKVCGENGSIKRGDLLVTSSQAGCAMKADLGKLQMGQVIGKALEGFDGKGNGKIRVLVNVK